MQDAVQLFEEAKRVIPGGVNSPVRSFGAVGGTPVFLRQGKGPYVFDHQGTRYTDYLGSWGAALLGHAHPSLVSTLQDALALGFSFGACHEKEQVLASRICTYLPSIEKVRLVSSGTEAVMSAIRLARGHTGRHKMIKFNGCYHGHVDSLLVKSGSGSLTFGVPNSLGVPPEYTQHTLVAEYNDTASVRRLGAAYADDIAAIIVEPVAGNMGCVPPRDNFLSDMRQLCDDWGCLLIFDEVMTGFRVDLHSAQGLYQIKPDLTILGKVIGGGMPLAAFGGRAAIMDDLTPLGGVYQAGTLSGHPIAVTAGLVSLDLLDAPGFYAHLNEMTRLLADGIRVLAKRFGVPLHVNAVPGMLTVFFTTSDAVMCQHDVMQCDADQFKRFFHALLKHHIYWPPSLFETAMLSGAHDASVVGSTLEIIETIFSGWQEKSCV